MNRILYFIVFLICLFIAKNLKDKSVNQGLIEVYKAVKEGNEERFLKALQQKGLKVFVSTFTIQFLKLKFYVNCDNCEKVCEVLKEMKIENLRFKDCLAVNQLMFSYSVERNDNAQIEYYYKILMEDLKLKDRVQFKQIADEIEFIYSIFIKKDFSLITELETRIEKAKDTASIAVLYYYKARLYYANEEINESRDALIKSIEVSNNDKWKAKIENILNSDLCQFN